MGLYPSSDALPGRELWFAHGPQGLSACLSPSWRSVSPLSHGTEGTGLGAGVDGPWAEELTSTSALGQSWTLWVCAAGRLLSLGPARDEQSAEG